MKVVFMSSDMYAMYTGVSLISMLENNAKNSDIEYVLLDNGLAESNRAHFYDIFDKYDVRYEIKSVKEEFERFSSMLPKEMPSFKGAMTTWLRMFPDHLFPGYDGVVMYVDSDTIIDGDISELCQLEWTDHVLCAADCDDAFMNSSMKTDSEEKMIISRRGGYKYFNAGIMLVNIHNFISRNGHDRIVNAVMKLHDFRFADQTVLNYAFSADEVLTMDQKYNYTIHTAPKFSRCYSASETIGGEKPVIIHYPGSWLKPWYRQSRSKLAYKFYEYQKLSPWRGMKESYYDSPIYKRLSFLMKVKERLVIAMYDTPLYARYFDWRCGP